MSFREGKSPSDETISCFFYVIYIMETTQKQGMDQGDQLLLRCCELRQRVYSLLQKSMDEGSRQYDEEMRKLHKEIEAVMAKM